MRLSWGVLMLLLAAEAAAESEKAPGGCARETLATGRPLERTLDVDGVERRFLLDVPPTLTAGTAVPVLFDFHGWGHSADGVWRVSRFKDFAADEKFITVYPDGLPVSLRPNDPRPGWQIRSIEGNRDIAFTRAMIELLERDYCIDRKRIYSTGFSNGAYFSHVLACVMPETIAAIAPVGGGHVTVPCPPEARVPVLFHHGTRDDVVPIERALEARDFWVERNGCGKQLATGADACERHPDCRGGAEGVFCRADVDHTWPADATRRIWDFVARHRR